MIQQVDNGGEILRRDGKKITALREKEAKKAIAIFVAAALPRLVRFRKENGSFERFFQLAKLSELRTVVSRKRVNRQSFQGIENGLPSFSGRACGNKAASDEPRTAVNKRDSRAFALRSDDGIAFPISDA